MRNSILPLTRILLPILAAGACAKTEKPPEQAPAAAAPPTVHVVATDYSFQAPDTLPAGLTTLHLMNQGKEPHHVTLLQLAEGQTIADFEKMMSGPPPASAVFLGGPNPAMPGGSAEATVNLKPGRYAVFCVIPSPDGKPHVAKGMIRELTVIPATTTVAEPVADVTLKLADYSFDTSAPLTAGHHVIRVENAGPQAHELVLVKLDSAKTVRQMLQWTEKMQGPPPGAFLGGVSTLSMGEAAYISLDLTPGNYGLMCFFPDAKDGKPHFLHGMVKEITVM